MSLLDFAHVACPYCGEVLEVSIEPATMSQETIEDCQVCCRPIQLRVDVYDPGDPPVVTARRDDD